MKNRKPSKEKTNIHYLENHNKRTIVSLNKLIDIFNNKNDITPDPYSFLSTSTPQGRSKAKFGKHVLRKNKWKQSVISKTGVNQMVKKTVPSADKSFDNGNIVSPTTQLELKNPPIVNGFTPVYQLKTFSAANFLSPCKDTQKPYENKLADSCTSPSIVLPNISTLMKSVYLEKCSLNYILNSPVVGLTEFGNTKSTQNATKMMTLSSTYANQQDYVLDDILDYTEVKESEYEVTEEIINSVTDSDPMDLLNYDKKLVMMTNRNYYKWKSYMKSSSSKSSN